MKRRYKISDPAILEAIAQYEAMLNKEQFSAHYVRQNANYAGAFLQWLQGESLAIEQVTYAEVLDYADKLNKNGLSSGHINRNLVAIRYYFNQLQKQGKAQLNPAAGLFLKGRISTLPQGLLTKAELVSLYEAYQTTDSRTCRNKVMLSLLIFQGLSTADLHRLETSHIKLKEGKIYIPSGRQTNSRVLKLEAEQIMQLHEYIGQVRPEILVNQKEIRPGRKPDHYQGTQSVCQLFTSLNGCTEIKNTLKYLILALKKYNPNLKDAKQIRQSVITEWLKEKDLRIVQYMCGHRYVSSTERYRESNLEELKEALNKYHPLK
jgi:integrase/recombinase XerD